MYLKLFSLLFLLGSSRCLSGNQSKVYHLKGNKSSKHLLDIKPNMAILDGVEDSYRIYKFIVKMRQDHTGLLCNGIMITELRLITSGSCCNDIHIGVNVKVYGGGYGDKEEIQMIEKVIPYYDYSNELCVIQLKHPFLKGVSIAELAENRWKEGDEKVCVFAEYGKTRRSNGSLTFSNKVFYDNLKVSQDNETCGCEIDDKLICYKVEKDEGPCQSSGSPLICDGVVQGLVAHYGANKCYNHTYIFGDSLCGNPDAVVYFRDVGYYIKWIKKKATNKSTINGSNIPLLIMFLTFSSVYNFSIKT